MRLAGRVLGLATGLLAAGCAQVLGTQGYVADLDDAGKDGAAESGSGSGSGSSSGSSSGGLQCQPSTVGTSSSCATLSELTCTSTSCCPSSAPYYCLDDSSCYGTQAEALAQGCPTGNCVVCGP